MELNETLQEVKKLMDTKKYQDTETDYRWRLYDTIVNDEVDDRLLVALNSQLKLVRCEEDFNFLKKVMNECGYGYTTFKKGSGYTAMSLSNHSYSSWVTDENGENGHWGVKEDPKYCTYICDGDDRRRKCQWQNLWRYIEISS